MLQPLSDTLSCDSALLHQYRADEAYNYARELQAPELDWWDWLMSKIGEFLSDLFSIQSKGDFRIVIYIVIALVFIALIAFILYRYQFKLFGRAGKVTNEMMKKIISMALTLKLSMPKQWHRRIITRLFELSICVHFVGYQMVIRLVGSSIRRQLNTLVSSYQ